MKRFNGTGLFATGCALLCLLWLIACLLPLPDEYNKFGSARMLALIIISAALFGMGLLGCLLTLAGKPLRALSFSMLFAALLHVVAFGAQPDLQSLVIVLSFLPAALYLFQYWRTG